MTVGAIILAAGSARRMGEDKLLADLGGKPMIRYVVDAVAAAGLPMPLVAVPPGREGLVAALDGYARPIVVADHAEGMGRSLAAAVGAIPTDWRAVIICLGDMPFVGPALLAELASRGEEGSIVTPMFEGRRGNPVAWGCDYFADLAKLAGDRGGRD
ncbi:MAG: nucleotidyltransferase family protein [Rhizorhabdus sp.]|nr:nucleotidyltransferase family protein [Rhizorhabdus sp.]